MLTDNHSIRAPAPSQSGILHQILGNAHKHCQPVRLVSVNEDGQVATGQQQQGACMHPLAVFYQTRHKVSMAGTYHLHEHKVYVTE